MVRVPQPPWTIRADGLRLTVRLSPKASTEGIDGIWHRPGERPALAIRVRAAPDRGQANRALEKLLAARFGIPGSRVTIVAGTTSRLKQVQIEGDPEELLDIAQRLWPSLILDEEPGGDG